MATCFLSDVIINLPFTNQSASVTTWTSEFQTTPLEAPSPQYNLEGVMRQVCLQPLPTTSSVHLPLIRASGPDLYSCRRLKRRQTLSTNRAPRALCFVVLSLVAQHRSSSLCICRNILTSTFILQSRVHFLSFLFGV